MVIEEALPVDWTWMSLLFTISQVERALSKTQLNFLHESMAMELHLPLIWMVDLLHLKMYTVSLMLLTFTSIVWSPSKYSTTHFLPSRATLGSFFGPSAFLTGAAGFGAVGAAVFAGALSLTGPRVAFFRPARTPPSPRELISANRAPAPPASLAPSALLMACRSSIFGGGGGGGGPGGGGAAAAGAGAGAAEFAPFSNFAIKLFILNPLVLPPPPPHRKYFSPRPKIRPPRA
mmetsp:Transcript_343/g.1157  ORF Transcript_343/g.1157 Transcript_343/m.1157 type:complete len:233 (-) Transcript_343:14-712(-)